MNSTDTNWTAASTANLSATRADDDESRQDDQSDSPDDIDNIVRSGSQKNGQGGHAPEASPPTTPRKPRG